VAFPPEFIPAAISNLLVTWVFLLRAHKKENPIKSKIDKVKPFSEVGAESPRMKKTERLT